MFGTVHIITILGLVLSTAAIFVLTRSKRQDRAPVPPTETTIPPHTKRPT